MRALTRALTLALVMGSVAGSPASASKPDVPVHDVATLAPACPENIHFLVRGDGEAPQGPASGRRSTYAAAEFRGAGEIVSRTVYTKGDGVVPVQYPALPPDTLRRSPKKWARSIAVGAKDLAGQINASIKVPCLVPSAKFLVGYSSGAAVIRSAVNSLSPQAQEQIAGIVVFGDPTADSREQVQQGISYKVKHHRLGLARALRVARHMPRPALRRYPSTIRDRVISYCHGYDVVCRLSSKPSTASARELATMWSNGSAEHANYGKGLTRQAASWIYRRHVRLAPQLDWDERPLLVGVESQLTFRGKGAFPPFNVSVNGADLAGTGLTAQGGSIVGTPIREFHEELEYTITDAVGRVTRGSVYLGADYTAPGIQVIDTGAAQDSSGTNIGSPSLSSDGRFVAFGSSANDRYASDRNSLPDIYLRDTRENTTLRLSVPDTTAEANGASTDPEISADGRVVAFASRANNLVVGGTYGIHVYDREARKLSWLGQGFEPELSSNGNVLAYRNNGQLVVVNRVNHTRKEVASDYRLLEFDLSGDGNWLILTMFTDAGLVIDKMHVDGSQRARVSTVANATAASISADGRFVSYSGTVNPPFYGDLYLADTATGTTTMIRESVLVESTSLSADGRILVYEMVSCRGAAAAVAYFDRFSGGTRGIWDSRQGAIGFTTGYAATPQVSADGTHVAFTNVPINGPIDVLLANVG